MLRVLLAVLAWLGVAGLPAGIFAGAIPISNYLVSGGLASAWCALWIIALCATPAPAG